MSSSQLVVLPIETIVALSALQVRAKTDPGTVKRYAQAMTAGAVFPPLEVAKLDGVLTLVDGFHRLAALKSRGERQALANVRQAATLEEARWWAAQANLKHGLPLRPAERRTVFRAYVSALEHRHGGRRRGALKSYREMSKELGIAHSTLRNWTRQDFPSVYAAMQEADNGNAPGGLPEPEPAARVFMRRALEGLDAALAALPGVASAADRGTLLDRVEALRAALEEAGTEPEAPF